MLVSSIAKNCTSLINQRIVTWAENNKKFCDEQFGFRRQKSTIDCLFVLQGLIQFAYSKGKALFCSFVDYSRPFDSVNYEALWYKLQKSDIISKLLNIIKSICAKIKLCVRADLVDKKTHMITI